MNSVNANQRRVVAFGIGGAGCNVLSQLPTDARGAAVESVAVNTDANALSKLRSIQTLQLGSSGEPAGAPERGRMAAKATQEAIELSLVGAARLYLFAGLGGGTGTGAIAEIARIACFQGVSVRAFVTTPFAFEGERWMQRALAGVAELRPWIEALEIVDNERSMKRFALSNTWDQVLHSANEELILRSGLKKRA